MPFAGAEAVLSCGLTESLLSVVDDYTIPVSCITFVTRAVRVLDLITNVEFAAFQTANGVHTLLRRLNVCVRAVIVLKKYTLMCVLSVRSANCMQDGTAVHDCAD